MEEQSSLFSDELKIDDTAKSHIRGMASWAMIMVVVAVIGYVLSILQAIVGDKQEVLTQSEGFTSSILSSEKSMSGVIISILVGLFINYFLFRFATDANRSVNSMNQELFSKSIRNLKIYFAVLSILMILALLFVLIFVFAMI